MNAPQSILAVVFQLLAGLALFLYGIDIMSRSLRKLAGPSIRKGFHLITRTRFHGLLAGIVITGIIQSSSATTVMIVGFINAGLFQFSQSIGVILGANIGATITPHITVFNLDAIALPLIGLGFLFTFFRKQGIKQTGFAVMGFGMLFFGLMLMKSAVGGYRTEIQEYMALFMENNIGGALIAFLISTTATAIIQSSAATVAMIQVIALTTENASIGFFLPIIVGAQIGTCITAVLASLQSTLSAKRAALAHLLFNVAGAIITLILSPLYIRLVPLAGGEITRQIANMHLFTRLINVALFLPFTQRYAWLITRILPGEDKLSAAPKYLDFQHIEIPEKALESAVLEISRMYETCLEMLWDAIRALIDNDPSAGDLVRKREALIDDLYKTTGEYLLKVSRMELSPELSPHPALWMHLMSDVERIGDHAENIVELAEVRSSGTITFTPEEIADMENTIELISEMGAEVNKTMKIDSEAQLLPVIEQKEKINQSVDRILDRHSERLEEGSVSPTEGILFVEVIMNLRRVANHLRNIAAVATARVPEHTAHVRKLKEELD